MVPLTDRDRLAAYKDALGNWSYANYIQFELTELAFEWVKGELEGISLKEIGRLMHEYVAVGGEIDEVRETRPEWSDDYEYHHDLRFTIQDRLVYIETRLNYAVPVVADASSILVVSIHAP